MVNIRIIGHHSSVLLSIFRPVVFFSSMHALYDVESFSDAISEYV